MQENRLETLIAAAKTAVNVWHESRSFNDYDDAMGKLADAVVEAQKRSPVPPLRKAG